MKYIFLIIIGIILFIIFNSKEYFSVGGKNVGDVCISGGEDLCNDGTGDCMRAEVICSCIPNDGSDGSDGSEGICTNLAPTDVGQLAQVDGYYCNALQMNDERVISWPTEELTEHMMSIDIYNLLMSVSIDSITDTPICRAKEERDGELCGGTYIKQMNLAAASARAANVPKDEQQCINKDECEYVNTSTMNRQEIENYIRNNLTAYPTNMDDNNNIPLPYWLKYLFVFIGRFISLLQELPRINSEMEGKPLCFANANTHVYPSTLRRSYRPVDICAQPPTQRMIERRKNENPSWATYITYETLYGCEDDTQLRILSSEVWRIMERVIHCENASERALGDLSPDDYPAMFMQSISIFNGILFSFLFLDIGTTSNGETVTKLLTLEQRTQKLRSHGPELVVALRQEPCFEASIKNAMVKISELEYTLDISFVIVPEATIFQNIQMALGKMETKLCFTSENENINWILKEGMVDAGQSPEIKRQLATTYILSQFSDNLAGIIEMFRDIGLIDAVVSDGVITEDEVRRAIQIIKDHPESTLSNKFPWSDTCKINEPGSCNEPDISTFTFDMSPDEGIYNLLYGSNTTCASSNVSNVPYFKTLDKILVWKEVGGGMWVEGIIFMQSEDYFQNKSKYRVNWPDNLDAVGTVHRTPRPSDKLGDTGFYTQLEGWDESRTSFDILVLVDTGPPIRGGLGLMLLQIDLSDTSIWRPYIECNDTNNVEACIVDTHSIGAAGIESAQYLELKQRCDEVYIGPDKCISNRSMYLNTNQDESVYTIYLDERNNIERVDNLDSLDPTWLDGMNINRENPIFEVSDTSYLVYARNRDDAIAKYELFINGDDPATLPNGANICDTIGIGQDDSKERCETVGKGICVWSYSESSKETCDAVIMGESNSEEMCNDTLECDYLPECEYKSNHGEKCSSIDGCIYVPSNENVCTKQNTQDRPQDQEPSEFRCTYVQGTTIDTQDCRDDISYFSSVTDYCTDFEIGEQIRRGGGGEPLLKKFWIP